MDNDNRIRNQRSGFRSNDGQHTQKRNNRFNQRVLEVREDMTMRTLIGLAIIVSVMTAANSTWKKIERDFAPQARASVERMNNSITSAVTKTTSNPFTGAPEVKQEATASNTRSNPTPTVIITQKGCLGMDCYHDLETPIPVIVASNIN